MTTSQIILSIFELLLIIAVFIGAVFEYKIIEFEKRLFKKIKSFWRWSNKMTILLLILLLPVLIILSVIK